MTITAGCTTSQYGYSTETWNSMSADEKELAISEARLLQDEHKRKHNMNNELQSIIHRAGKY